jgi:NTP pyrophosphatase (non-canonical NTP hydrolase)
MALAFDEYKASTRKTALYPGHSQGSEAALTYAMLGLAGEAGELCNTYKKVLRDDDGIITPGRLEKIKNELGDVLWYIARVADELSLSLDDVARQNLAKLMQRKAAGTIHGDGDNR